MTAFHSQPTDVYPPARPSRSRLTLPMGYLIGCFGGCRTAWVLLRVFGAKVNPPRVSEIGQVEVWQRDRLTAMVKKIHVVRVEQGGEDGVVVTFSDGTVAGYVVEELLSLRPIRETLEESQDLDGVTRFTWTCHLN